MKLEWVLVNVAHYSNPAESKHLTPVKTAISNYFFGIHFFFFYYFLKSQKLIFVWFDSVVQQWWLYYVDY